MHLRSVSILSSGSCGNSTFVRCDGSAILVDAGLSCTELERRMSLVGADPAEVDALLLTHEHTDHTRGVQRFCSKYGTEVYGTDGTLSLTPLQGIKVKAIRQHDPFDIGPIHVRPFPVKHFAAEPVAFSIDMEGRRVGIASDLGCVTRHVLEGLDGSDLVLVEANYDDEMLMKGSYPDFLKRTIKSDHGHLSNADASSLSVKASGDRTKRIVLVHLSKENNTPLKARKAVEEALRRHGSGARVDVTEHGSMNGPFEL
jgi:phosphoribosyl 1,2-cyclic phosphodiesterase